MIELYYYFSQKECPETVIEIIIYYHVTKYLHNTVMFASVYIYTFGNSKFVMVNKKHPCSAC